MISSTILGLLLFCTALTMRIPNNDPVRNRTIVQVLAAHCNVGIILSPSGSYEYDTSLPFKKILDGFLKAYLEQ